MALIDPVWRPTSKIIAHTLQRALERGLVGDECPAAIFFDLERFGNRLDALDAAFPAPTLNSLAVKANPLPPLLSRAAARGFGAECASLGELHIARRAGFPADRIVFDSPVKTKAELAYAIDNGYNLNIDNIEECMRVRELVEDGHEVLPTIGLRINPSVGAGSLDLLSTATANSKFGITISDARSLLRAYPDVSDWLNGLHLHVGSQGCPLELFLRGAEAVVRFAEELGEMGVAIEQLDIGGGLPVRYHDDDEPIEFAAYAAALARRVPTLASYRLVTEFGRSVFLYPGWAAARVEYTKRRTDPQIASCHLGADMFLRAAYIDWYHDIMALGADGRLKAGEEHAWDIAGPLCFSGDYLARSRALPDLEPGDWLVIRDAGAYTFSMWSRYNARAFPPIYGYSETAFTTLHPGRSAKEIGDEWFGR